MLSFFDGCWNDEGCFSTLSASFCVETMEKVVEKSTYGCCPCLRNLISIRMSQVVGRVSENSNSKVTLGSKAVTKPTHHKDVVFTHLIFIVIGSIIVQVRVGGVRLFVPVRVERKP